MLPRRVVIDEEAHSEALREAADAEAMRDADSTLAAAAFEGDSGDLFSKLARYEASVERSLYKAVHELQRLQAARTGGKVVAPVALDVNVDMGPAGA